MDSRFSQDETNKMGPMVTMDATDAEIIRQLRQDGRASFTHVGEVVGLSATAVKRRVDQLVDSGIIKGFTVVLGANTDDRKIEAYVEIYCRGTVSPGLLHEALIKIPEVKSAGTITGSADAIVRVVADDVPMLEKAIERIRDETHVDHTVTSILLTPILNRL